jgi:glutamate 5-kinase
VQLLTLGAVPVVNENDTVATTEIRFGDNDRLAARVAAMISADTLVLLSDIDGLYERDPRQDSNAKHIAQVDEINPQIEAMAGKAPTGYSSGGMETKIQAAKVATAAGCRMAIMNGIDANPLRRLVEGARCTWFIPSASPLTARKRWIVGSLNPVGEILVDAGAERALKQGKSLLPAGVIRIQGAFERGDAVIVRAADGNEMARGLSAYSNADAARIAGRKSGEIEKILGYRGRDELIHRDDLVLTV